MFYLFWITGLVLYMSVYAYISNYTCQNKSWNGVFLLCGMNLIGLWPLVAKYSHNIIYDALLYDTIMTLTFYIILCLIGTSENLSVNQYVCLTAVIGGLLLFKVV